MKIVDNYHLLTPQQLSLLSSCASLPFLLGKYKSLDDVLTSQYVDVIIEPGIVTRPIPSELHEIERYWIVELDRIGYEFQKAENRETAQEDMRTAKEMVGVIREEMEQWTNMPLRGSYSPVQNVIRLYPEEMMQEYSGTRMDELLVSTFAHETMHAYFDRPWHKRFPYVILVEEPLAEYGMLLYLQETVNTYYNWAYQDVSRKMTCYRYGAKLMDQHLREGLYSSVRRFLEAYKIKLNKYSLLTVNPGTGMAILPNNGGHSISPVQVGGHTIRPHWLDVFKSQPRYFYDQSTCTLGFDGDWRSNTSHGSPYCVDIDIMIHILPHYPVNQIYLGDNFAIEDYHDLNRLLSEYEVFVSLSNKLFFARNGVPFFRNNNTPVLSECGDGLYELCRNGKWGIVDTQLNQITPFNYDCIWSFDKNDLVQVRIDNGSNYSYGLVNKCGQEQVPVKYEHITYNVDGTYTVKQNGSEFKINKLGNKI